MRRSWILLTFAFLTVLATAAHAAEFKDVHKVVPIDANGRVTLDAHNGSVTVSPSNQPNVSIDARIEPVEHFDHPEDVQKTEVRVTGGGKNVGIESDYSAITSHITLFGIQQSNPPIHYTIHMPATAQLHLTVHNATVKVTGIKGDLEVRTHNGSVDVVDTDGASIETHNGSVRLVFANVERPSGIETHNGSADVVVPATARMTVKVDGHRSGVLSSDLPMTVKASGSISTAMVNGGGPELKFTTHNGSMRLSRR
jgi:hypothetical protein